MPMPLSRTANSPMIAVAAGGNVDLRRAVAAELDAVADQVLEQLDHLVSSAWTVGSESRT